MVVALPAGRARLAQPRPDTPCACAWTTATLLASAAVPPVWMMRRCSARHSFPQVVNLQANPAAGAVQDSDRAFHIPAYPQCHFYHTLGTPTTLRPGRCRTRMWTAIVGWALQPFLRPLVEAGDQLPASTKRSPGGANPLGTASGLEGSRGTGSLNLKKPGETVAEWVPCWS